MRPLHGATLTLALLLAASSPTAALGQFRDTDAIRLGSAAAGRVGYGVATGDPAWIYWQVVADGPPIVDRVFTSGILSITGPRIEKTCVRLRVRFLDKDQKVLATRTGSGSTEVLCVLPGPDGGQRSVQSRFFDSPRVRTVAVTLQRSTTPAGPWSTVATKRCSFKGSDCPAP